jgi:hypothetical protein
MGKNMFDQYSLLHFATGIILYFWNIALLDATLLHILFEIIENTNIGMYIINKYITMWPGGKPFADSFDNSMIGDNISFIVGWLVGYVFDYYGKKYDWYGE